MWRRLKLRQRLAVIFVGAMTAFMACTSGYLIDSHQRAMLAQMSTQTRMMREELEKKGIAIAVTVAQASERALATEDFLFLAQVLETTKSTDKQFLYGTLTNQKGIAVVHTSSDHAGLPWPTAQGNALTEPGVQTTSFAGHAVLEAAAPLNVAGEPWGAVRFGLSLQELNAAVVERENTLSAQLKKEIITSLAVTLALILMGVALGVGSANSLLSPMRGLLLGVQNLREGRLDSSVLATGSPEFVDLAQSFNEMAVAVKRREKALEAAFKEADEANRYKLEFLANVSHELRTPLNAILNVPGALLEDFRTESFWRCPQCQGEFDLDPAKAAQATAPELCLDCGTELTLIHEVKNVGNAAEHKLLNERALKSAEHLLRLVNDLLDFSRLQAKKLELQVEPVDVVVLMADVMESLRGLAETKQIALKHTVGPDLGSLPADRVRLTQVLINLVGNALKFTPERGRVDIQFATVAAADGSRQALISVRDTGIGISPSQIKIIFEPFRQADGGHTRRYEGTGLGLAIVKQIVDLHGGRVWAESEPGVGSTFWVSLPAQTVAAPQDDAAVAPKRQLAGQGQRVVIIDDDASYVQVGEALLRRAGFRVEALPDVQQAAEFVSAVQPDFVIMDVMMPKISGFDVLRRLRAQEATRDIPVLVSSGYQANEAIARSLGALWLAKPWHGEELQACLDTNQVLKRGEP